MNWAQVVTGLAAAVAATFSVIQGASTMRTNVALRDQLEQDRKAKEDEREYRDFVAGLYARFTEGKGMDPWYTPKTDREKVFAARAAADGHLMIPSSSGGGSSSYLLNRNKGYG
ncbi:MAG: hypothetical protein ACLPJH_19535 [Myxococcaceae bacterium]